MLAKRRRSAPCNEWRKSGRQSVDRLHVHSVARRLLPDPFLLDNWDVEERKLRRFEIKPVGGSRGSDVQVHHYFV